MTARTPITTRFRFEMVCEAVAPDGTRTRLGAFDIPTTCLICGRSMVDDDMSVTGKVGTVDNRIGFICPGHEGVWVR